MAISLLTTAWAPSQSRLPEWLRAYLGLDQPIQAQPQAVTQASLGAVGVLSIWASCMLVLLALANTASLQALSWADSALWAALAALVWPFAARLSWPDLSERERVGLVVALAMALYLVRILHNPLAFVNHDEFLHWRNVEDILASGKLFTPNPLLPISPLYPGLALTTAALVQLTGLSVFAAGAVVVGVARLIFVLSTYAVFKQLSDSSRIAALGTLICMASSNFIFFHGQFAYESLAIALAMLCFASALHVHAAGAAGFVARLPLVAAPLMALAMTHHLSAYFVAGVLALVTVFSALFERRSGDALRLAILTALAAGISLGWQLLIGNPTGGYLTPILVHAMNRIAEIIATGEFGRELFVSSAGDVLPLWQQVVTLASVALVGLGLVTGLLRAWLQRDARPAAAWVGIFLLLAAAYPLCVVMRLDDTTWEIGNRLGSFFFIAVAYVIAHAVVGLWQGQSRSLLRTGVVASALTVMLLGGVVSGFGPLVQPGPYLVGGENRAIEAQGIDAARWTRQYLGENHVFAADRTNRLLTSVYGRQRLVTSLYDNVELSSVFLAPQLGAEQRLMIDRLAIEYAVVDDRLATRLPFVGHYYEMQEAPSGHKHPASLAALNKFDGMAKVSRVFDSGDIAIYDLRGLHGRK